jgi:nitrogen fixation NifU-like protein
MGDTLDDFVHRLQQQIYNDTREAYGVPAFERWLNPLYNGTIENPDGYACVNGKCGDTMEIFLRFDNVCGSFTAEMALGKRPDEILEITGEAIIERLGGLPSAERHCAFLSAETLQEALNDYMSKQTRKKR